MPVSFQVPKCRIWRNLLPNGSKVISKRNSSALDHPRQNTRNVIKWRSKFFIIRRSSPKKSTSIWPASESTIANTIERVLLPWDPNLLSSTKSLKWKWSEEMSDKMIIMKITSQSMMKINCSVSKTTAWNRNRMRNSNRPRKLSKTTSKIHGDGDTRCSGWKTSSTLIAITSTNWCWVFLRWMIGRKSLYLMIRIITSSCSLSPGTVSPPTLRTRSSMLWSMDNKYLYSQMSPNNKTMLNLKIKRIDLD